MSGHDHPTPTQDVPAGDEKRQIAGNVDSVDPVGEQAQLESQVESHLESHTATPPPEKQPERVYPKGIRFALLTTGLMLVVLVVALDNYILSTAVPAITSDFQSLSDIGWYGSSYFLTQMAFQPSFGKLYRHFHIKTVFAVSIIVFEVGSILCAAATSSAMFIVGRLIAGIGGGGLYVGTIIMVGHAVPVVQVPFYVSIVTSMYGVASIVGPILGGIFTDTPRLTWRFCFWINLPIGFVSFLVIVLLCKSPKQGRSTLPLKERIKGLDLGGSLLLIAGFVCLLLAMQWGGIKYPWGASQVVGSIVGFVVIIAAFLVLQMYLKENGSLPIRLFHTRTATFGFIYTVCLNLAITAAVYWVPLYYQSALGYSAFDSGIKTLPYLTPLLFAPVISGFFITKVGRYVPFMWASGIMSTVGMGLLIALSATISQSWVIGALFLAGFGSGFGRQIALSAFQHVLPKEDIPLASMLFSWGMALGGVFATSLTNAVFSNRFADRLYAAGVANVPAIVTGGATDFAQYTTTEALPIVQDACARAISDTFVMSTIFSGIALLCSLGMKWANVKK